MATLCLSRAARADLLSIGAYTLKTWGPTQAAHYLSCLEQSAKMLAVNPSLGRPCNSIRPGLNPFEKGRHVLFYRRQDDGILVSRILHQSMLPDQQVFEDMEPDASKR
jgi:toxin ParE1/3/4